jgi:hypothetical protein
MIFSVESERLRLMRSESNDMIKKTKETSLCFEIVYGSCCVYIETWAQKRYACASFIADAIRVLKI